MQYGIQCVGEIGYPKLNNNLPVNKQKNTLDAMFIVPLKLLNMYLFKKYSIALYRIFDSLLTLAAA